MKDPPIIKNARSFSIIQAVDIDFRPELYLFEGAFFGFAKGLECNRAASDVPLPIDDKDTVVVCKVVVDGL